MKFNLIFAKKLPVLIFAAACCLSACSKKEPASAPNEALQNETVQAEAGIEMQKLEENIENKDFRFVNAMEGLRIRKSPGMDSEKTGILKNKEKVEVISEVEMPTQIGMLYSNWLEIKTESGFSGFVFGGYLEKSIKDIDAIQEAEGKYADPNGTNFVTIEYRGGKRFRIKTDYPMFGKKTNDMNVDNIDDIFTKNLFFADLGGRGGQSDSFYVRFNLNGQLVFFEESFRADFDDNLNVREEKKAFNETVMKKVSAAADENPRITQDYEESLSTEEEKSAYREIADYLNSKSSFILAHYDSEKPENGTYFYKGNFLMGPETMFVNNELLENCPVKIGTAKTEIYDLLGMPFRLIRDKNTDSISYTMTIKIAEDEEDAQTEISTSIDFCFDKNGVVSQISFLAECI